VLHAVAKWPSPLSEGGGGGGGGGGDMHLINWLGVNFASASPVLDDSRIPPWVEPGRRACCVRIRYVSISVAEGEACHACI